MTSKKEYSKIFNELLGIEVNWTKLSKEELAVLSTIFAYPDVLLSKLGGSDKFKTDAVRDKFIDTAIDVIQDYDGPIISILRKALTKEKEK